MTYSKIKCFFGKHIWKYNTPTLLYKKEFLIGGSPGQVEIPIESKTTRICENCFRKEARNIVDLGRTILWQKTNEYTTVELREINLNRLLED